MEQWRDIPGYETLYQASDHGRIRTCEGKITRNERYAKRVWKQRAIKQKVQIRKNGRKDARVHLWKNGEVKTMLVARLVAMTWVDGYSPELTVNHRDGNPLNNKAENLEWITLAANIKQGFEDGLYSTCHPIRLKAGNMIFHHDSMAKASRSLGRNSGYIYNCLKKGRPIIGTTGVRYEIVPLDLRKDAG